MVALVGERAADHAQACRLVNCQAPATVLVGEKRPWRPMCREHAALIAQWNGALKIVDMPPAPAPVRDGPVPAAMIAVAEMPTAPRQLTLF